MRKSFTQTYGRQFLTLAMTAFVCFAMTAQMTLEVVAPSGIARTYEIGNASYGGNAIPSITGSVVLTEDGTALPNEGCNAITNDVVGKIAFSDRGTCNFSVKAFNAQEAGAIAAIMCNTNDEVFNIARGTNAELVTIPHVVISSSDCQAFKAAMQSEDVVVNLFYANWGFDDVLWGDGADGADFDEDFSVNGWTTAGITDTGHVWQRQEIPLTDGSCGSFYIQSPTAGNGAAMCDADGILSGGSTFPCGTGVGPFNSELISPLIDCTNFDATAVRLWQFNLPISISESDGELGTNLSWSTDGGTTWSNPVNIATNSEQNTGGAQYANAEKFELVVPEIAGQENVKIKLTYNRSRGFYMWAVDDVAIIRPADYDVVLENSFYTPLSFATPVNHLATDTFGFSANIWNAGIKDDVQVVTTVRIVDEMGVEMMNQSDTRTVPALTRDTVNFNSISPMFPEGKYNIFYDVAFDGGVADENPQNNDNSYPFEVTSDIFGKEMLAQDDISNFTTAASDPWYYGPFYTISSQADENNRRFKGIQLACGATDEVLDGENFTMYILKWEDPNDGYPAFAAELNMPLISPLDHPFMTIVGFAAVDPSGLANNQLFSLNVEDGAWFDENGSALTELVLDAGATYGFISEFSGADVGLSSGNGPNLAGVPGLLQNYQGGGEYFTGFTTSYPVVRLMVSGGTADENIELTTTQANVFPTLTNDVINIELNFGERTEATIMITNMTGVVQSFTKLGAISDYQATQDVSDFAPGMYLINIESALGTKQVPFTVIK